MIDFDKIHSQLNNIKDLDPSDLAKTLREHKNSLIMLALTIGLLLMAVWLFNNRHINEQSLRAQISQGKKKLEVLRSRDASIQNLNNLKSSLPKKLNELQLITLISNYAKKHHVTITSLSPAEIQDMGLYDVINVSFEGGFDDFKDMVLFLREIEKSDFPLRVDSWLGHAQENGRIIFTIGISAVLIHI